MTILRKLRKSINKSIDLLESKSGIVNLRKKFSAGEQQKKKPIPLPTSESTHTRFKSFLEAKRIISRPISIIRPTDSDILHFKEDNYDAELREKDESLAIPILPADEMGTLTSEIKVWKRNRRWFIIIYVLVQILGASAMAIDILFAVIFYTENYALPGSQKFDLHMSTQMFNMCLLTNVVMLFRLGPNTRTKNIILAHVLLGILSFSISGASIYIAVAHHHVFMQKADHLHSVHSWLGLLAMGAYLIAFISGFIFVCYPTDWLRRIHAPSGSATLNLSSAAVLSGFYTRALFQLKGDYVKGNLPAILVNVFGVILCVIVMLVRLTLSDFVFRRRPKPQWDVIVHRNLEAIEEAYFDVHYMYSDFEHWVKQVNDTRTRALRIRRPDKKKKVSVDLGSKKQE